MDQKWTVLTPYGRANLTESVTFSLTVELRKWIEQQAANEKRSMSDFVRLTLEEKRKEQKPSDNK